MPVARVLLTALAALALLAGVADAALVPAGSVDVPGRGPVACVRPAADRVAHVVRGRGGPEVRLRRATEAGLAPAGAMRLGPLVACPAVGAAPGAPAAALGVVDAGPPLPRGVTAASARPTAVRAAVGDGPPVTLRRLPALTFVVASAVAVGPGGHAVAAWAEVVDGGGRSRFWTSRAAPGGAFGPPELVTELRGAGEEDALVALGVDGRGDAVLALARPLPGRPGGADREEVLVATLPAGGPPGRPVRLGAPSDAVDALDVAVAPDGGALVAHDTGFDGTVRVHERAPGAAGFGALPGVERASGPAVAVRDGGGAVLAWRADAAFADGGVVAATRLGPGRFGPPRVVAPAPAPAGGDGLESTVFTVALSSPGDAVPVELSPPGLDAVLAPDGRVALAFLDPSSRVRGDAPLAARAAAGTLAAGVEPAPARTPVALPGLGAAALLADVAPAALLTDGTSYALTGTQEIARGDGRLALAVDRPGPAPAVVPARPPRLTVAVAPQALRPGEPLDVRVGCDAACDVRAHVVGSEPRAIGTAVLRAAGTRVVAVEPTLSASARLPRRARLVVRARLRGGGSLATVERTVRIGRRPARPLPRVVGLRARRDALVTWRTRAPAVAVAFTAAPGRLDGRPSRAGGLRIGGAGRRSFALRLPTRRAGAVTLRVQSERPPYRSAQQVVPVRDGGGERRAGR